MAAAIAAQVASAPSTPALASSWRPLEASRVGAESRVIADLKGEDEGEEESVAARQPAAQDPPSGGDNDDDDGPRWPDENAEASALAGQESGPTTIREQLDHAAATAKAEQAESVRDLPPLDDLIAKIPDDVREGLEDLFRVKFTKVRRLPRRVFTSPPAES